MSSGNKTNPWDASHDLYHDNSCNIVTFSHISSRFVCQSDEFQKWTIFCERKECKWVGWVESFADAKYKYFLSFLTFSFSIFIKPLRTKENFQERHEVIRQMCIDGMALEWKVWVSAFLIFFAFLLPCTLLTYFYAKIVLRLRRQRRYIFKMMSQHKKNQRFLDWKGVWRENERQKKNNPSGLLL